LILEHNEDEEAHLGTGQSLQSHKASEIIDHVAQSIISDKIKDNEISPEKFSFGDRFYFNGIQTLDCFGQSIDGSGGSITLENYGDIVLVAGTAVGNITRAYISPIFITLWNENNPVLEARINDGQDYNADSAIVIGCDNPFSTTHTMVGFRYKYSTNKTYAFYVYYSGGSYITEEVAIFDDVFVSYLMRIEVDSANHVIRYYKDGILVKTYDYGSRTLFTGTAQLFSFGTKRQNVAGVTRFHVWNLFFTKEGSTEE